MMQKINSSLVAIILSLVAVVLTAVVVFANNPKKIAYVRTAYLINEYKGMKEARIVYEDKSKAWSSNMDTLSFNFQRALNKFNMETSKMTADERKNQEANLRTQQRMLKDYEKEISKTAKEEEEQMTSGVLNQINSYIDSYGKDKGYDLIFGTDASGSLLYGKGNFDITEEILTGLNFSYNQNSTINSNHGKK